MQDAEDRESIEYMIRDHVHGRVLACLARASSASLSFRSTAQVLCYSPAFSSLALLALLATKIHPVHTRLEA